MEMPESLVRWLSFADFGGGIVSGIGAGCLFFIVSLFIINYLYFLPRFIAEQRRHPDTLAIFALNLLLGWTFIGWAIGMVWALKSFDEDREIFGMYNGADNPIVNAIVYTIAGVLAACALAAFCIEAEFPLASAFFYASISINIITILSVISTVIVRCYKNY